MEATCPVDSKHKSTDPLYCSVCGARILPATSAHMTTCPDCQTERKNLSVNHCEVCRYNFETKSYNRFKTTVDLRSKSGAQRLVESANPVGGWVNKEPVESPVEAGIAANKQWAISIRVDPSLYIYPDPQVPCPKDDPERICRLDVQETLIGRKSESRRVYPDICLTDPGVSHRHFKLLKDPQENLYMLDVGSANGTQLNGSHVDAGMKRLLHNGDEITLGCWTRIVISQQNKD
ncbi:MAG TPA: FHA domain-containing protein [Oculatellaceae cyanobacterium]